MLQTMFGPYRIEELLGRGGMGEVYRAYDTQLDRTVALKLLPAHLAEDDEYQARFRRECKVAARLSDPHVVPIHRFGEIDGRLYLDMRLIDGIDLDTWLQRYGPLPLDAAAAVVGQVAEALDAAHAEGLLHRDVKPSNILLAGVRGPAVDAASVFVYVVNFGIRPNRTGAGTLTAAGVIPDSPSYVAPERFAGIEGDPRSDVYALACVLHQALTGRPPFEGDLPSLMRAHLTSPPPRPSTIRPEVPSGLDDVVGRGMAKDPDTRYATAGELARAARDTLAPPSTAGPAEATGAAQPRPPAPPPGFPPRPLPAGPSPAAPHPQRPPVATPPTMAPQQPPRRLRRWRLPGWPWRRREPRTRPPAQAEGRPPVQTKAPPPATTPPDRRVAVAVLDSRGAAPASPLVPAGGYLLRFTIGGELLGDVVRHAPAFPVGLLRRDTTAGWWLTFTVHGDGVRIPEGPHPFFLPTRGPGWTCSCRPGGAHSCRPDDRWAAVDLPFRAPVDPGIRWLTISVHAGATLVQAVQLTLPVGAVGPLRPSAVVTYSLGPDLGDAAQRAPRDMSVLSESVNDRHRLHVKGIAGPPLIFEFVDAAAAEGARHLRGELFASHLMKDGLRWTSRYGPGHGTDLDTYTADLRRLAVAGSEVFVGVFGRQGSTLRAQLAEVSSETGRPAELQVARAVNTRLTVPWQLVYDEPIDDVRPPMDCASIGEFGPGTSASDIPPLCPHVATHDRARGTLCPFGFWGLAHHVECPPPTFTRSLPEVTGDELPASLTVALHPDLAVDAWSAHDRVLRALGGRPAIHEVEALRQSVLMGTDVLYFYCHGARLARAGGSAPRPVLDLGRGGQLSPLTLHTWAAGNPPVRWHRRRPLVVLNGCHTGEVLPDVPAELVASFVDGLGASGVVATEIAVEASLAATAMELFLEQLFSGRSVGAAMRRMRWALLARGNVLGLAYATYCDARLRLPGPGHDDGSRS